MSGFWMALALLASAPQRVTPEALRARYANVQQLTADVTQRKEGKYWARPFESRIRLRYTPERVVWETLSPIRSTVVLDGAGITVTGPGGEKRDLGPGGSDPRLAAIVRFIRALLAFDLAGMERDFLLTYGEGEVVASPRPTSDLQLFKAIRIQIDERLDIVSIDLETESERTHLTFNHVQRLPETAH